MKYLKGITLVVVIVCSIISCRVNNSIPITDPITISGRITNYIPETHNSIVKFAFNDLIRLQETEFAYINQDGTFHLETIREFPQDFYLIYGQLVTLYCSPGDSLFIEIDANILNEEDLEFSESYKYMKVTGSAEIMNNHLIDFLSIDSLHDFKTVNHFTKTLKPNDYKNYEKKRYLAHKAVAKKFIKEHRTSPQFSEWIKHHLFFEMQDNIMRYAWRHPSLNKIKEEDVVLPEDYFAFLDQFDPFDLDPAISTNYYSFIHEYYMHTINLLTDEFYLNYETLIRKGKRTEATLFKIEQISQSSDGFIKDVFVARELDQLLNWDRLETFDTVFSSTVIENTRLSEKLLRSYNDIISNRTNPELPIGSDLTDLSRYSHKSILDTIITKHAGKVVYIDFWAPWCSPCMTEIAVTNELKIEFKDKNVAFVYLANNCTEESWKATISRKNISGDHYLLTDDQYSNFQKEFDISGIPHYVVINKEGKIVNKKAPWPSMRDDFLNTVNKLLDE